jgi:hypothetical protein
VRQITRRVLAVFVLVALGLLALGALPSYLGSGDPYYLTATPTDAAGPTVNVTDVSERRYPYLTTALTTSEGRSAGYRRGPVGFKEAFTHSPFDEVDALVTRAPDARTDGGILVEYKGQRYRVEVTQQ